VRPVVWERGGAVCGTVPHFFPTAAFIPERKAVTLAVDKEQVRRKPPAFLSLHDQELLAAKNNGSRVRIVLAVETYYTDEQCQLFCYIEKVDKFAIRVKLVTDISIWLMKQAILSTEVVA
jgi:hypothetical protein